MQASCNQGKGSPWSEAQLTQIGNSPQAVWGHDHEIVQIEWDQALKKDHSSFKMCKMMIKTDQLLCIAEAINLKVGQSPWQHKSPGIVIKTIPHLLLLAI